MELNLNGKVALVTASSNGIGLAIASSLAAEGAKVAVNGRTEQSVDKALANIRAALPGGRSHSARGRQRNRGWMRKDDRAASIRRHSRQQPRHLRSRWFFDET